MNILLPESVKYILQTLKNNGYEAFIVGGCVRDSILGLKPNDWDITTNALPEQVEDIFSLTYPTGKKYGTITVAYIDEQSGEQSNYEVTTYRLDQNYSDGRRPDSVKFSKSLKADLKRRDFTINAMAYNEEEGLIDYFNGLRDLKNRKLKTVGNPYERFNEDALRVIRALRFAANYDLKISAKTERAIHELTNEKYLDNISSERIHDEIIKMCPALLKSKYLTKRFKREIELIFKSPLPLEIDDLTTQDTYTSLSFYYYDNSYIEEILKRLKFSNEEIKNICYIRNASRTLSYICYEDLFSGNFYDLWRIRKAISDTSVEHCNKALDLIYDMIIKPLVYSPTFKQTGYLWSVLKFKFKEVMKTITSRESKNPTSLKDLAIDGEYIKRKFKVDGKAIGIILDNCLERVIKFPDENNKKDLSNFISKISLSKEMVHGNN